MMRHNACSISKPRYANYQRQTLRTITGEQKRQILQLAGDFPRLWNAPTTETRDRKRLLRLLIKDITVVKHQSASNAHRSRLERSA